MRVRSVDTDPVVERVQLTLLREAGPARRAALALSMSQSALELARRAIRRAEPELSDEDAGVRFVELHYGADLARRLRADLRSRERER